MIEIIIPPCSSLVSIPALSLSLFNVLAKWKISMTQLNKYMLYFFSVVSDWKFRFEDRQDGCSCLINALLLQMEEIWDNSTECQDVYKKYEMREFCDTEQVDKINEFSPLPPLRSHYKSFNSLNGVPEFLQPVGELRSIQNHTQKM